MYYYYCKIVLGLGVFAGDSLLCFRRTPLDMIGKLGEDPLRFILPFSAGDARFVCRSDMSACNLGEEDPLLLPP